MAENHQHVMEYWKSNMMDVNMNSNQSEIVSKGLYPK